MTDTNSDEVQVVTPFEVENLVDYDKLIDQFGSSKIDQDLVARIEKVTGKPAHPWLKRGIFFSHRDMHQMLDLYEQGKPFYLYTGRGPSSEALHLGHLIPFHFTKWLQEVFSVPLVIQLTDDEKALWKDGLEITDSYRLGYGNAKDIIACGFDKSKTFIFSDVDYIGYLLPNVLKIQSKVTFNQVRGIFGFTEEKNVGQVGFPAIQAAPSFSSTFPVPLQGAPDMPCLIPCAIDQDPYFRMTRDVADKLKLRKPALIHSVFFPSLQGPKSKMSASNSNSAIYVTDTPEQIRDKIMVHSYCGEEGAEKDLAEHVPYQWLRFYLHDDEKLEKIGEDYLQGVITSDDIKEELIQLLMAVVKTHQDARLSVDDKVIDDFMAVRPLTMPSQ